MIAQGGTERVTGHRPVHRYLIAAWVLQAMALVAVVVLMVAASDRIAGAYAWAQMVPVGLFAAMTAGIGLWAARATTKAPWITGIVAHLVALPIYGAWVFFWTFVFGMERGAGDFIDRSIIFSTFYALALLLIAFLFLGAKPNRLSSAKAP